MLPSEKMPRHPEVKTPTCKSCEDLKDRLNEKDRQLKTLQARIFKLAGGLRSK